MGAWFLGTAGFILYLFYDINSLKWQNRILHKFFWAGTFCVIISAVWSMTDTAFENRRLPIVTACGLGGLFFLALLIYTLFFAIPFDETYVEESRGRMACREGVYALCRHPGVLWFAGLFLCLWGVTGDRVRGIYFLSMILWNLLYVVFQDIATFPRTFINYGEYKKTTPFILPDRKSIRACFGGKKRDVKDREADRSGAERPAEKTEV